MAFKIYAGVLLLFAIGNLLFFISAPLLYHLHLRSLRKALYTIFIGAITAGIMLDEIQLLNWKFILTLTSINIFMDLSLLLTPSIMKIWSTEFQYSDYVENVVKENEKVQIGSVRRVQTMSEMLQNSKEYLSNSQISQNSIDYISHLQTYLERYAHTYGLSIRIWSIEPETMKSDIIPAQQRIEMSHQEIIEALIYEGIATRLNEIERLLSYDFGDNKTSYISALYQSEIVSLSNEDSMIIPVYLDKLILIILLRNETGQLLEVDGIHIVNLTHLYALVI
ncbi:type II toxin-antitoxin system SpoIISA family toxin [Paenibacillus melissococcoides]|uniref:Type II toxin-antitoxin system SpoIISA family toxin n=1 Tax=Paenibacillus melissococcoides TaxID=2912268 RepID=A0ABM9G7Q4_9BACL|nr:MULTISPECIES: type II toxin-antitoxin system SpoIISA family toxin [Paenibacillus]MEB9896801.1 type II toxin-antitoxin system SpoIISA family toxin [Bacillus cereus]CAH8247804.1 type II toxin-antitoxin system SpoIISA family toxin [Paenibacillus melissococcoides]CAH8719492.1 type II toxin-antitoxin system SpoIISA family toxin [Paenibacillus melissococcoides]CAH8720500.1 type II toxin-antitoxin system SpoIISA family toxin [Paenibacillus melissococcoides]GIO81260.1 hypothetical protein J6TS7_487